MKGRERGMKEGEQKGTKDTGHRYQKALLSADVNLSGESGLPEATEVIGF